MLKRKMQQEKIYGALIKMSVNSSIPYLVKQSGLDFIFYDCEHAMISYEKLQDLIPLGNALGVDSVVRVSSLTRHDICGVLDCGATGIMVPMIETVEQAKQFIEWACYPPFGKRSYSGGANTNYRASGNHQENMDEMNQKTILIAQIESADGVKNVEEIAQLPELDALLVGPADLAISLGYPGDYSHTEVKKSIKRISEVCKKYKKAMGIIASMSVIQEYYQDLTIIVEAIDTNILREGFSKSYQQLTQLGKEE